MNWYKIAQQQEFPFMRDLYNYRSKRKYSTESMDDLDWEEALDEVSSDKDIVNVCKFYKIPFEKIDFKNNIYVYLLQTPEGKKVIDDFTLFDPYEWLEDLDIKGKLEYYVSTEDINEEFWSNPPFVYHGTTEDNWYKIEKTGLQPRNETRGLSNRSIGASVFTSLDVETALHYYDIVIKINCPQMKEDGYMPYVGQETPLEEAEAKESIANMIGLENYEADYEVGLDPDTFIFYGAIPPKYLKRVK